MRVAKDIDLTIRSHLRGPMYVKLLFTHLFLQRGTGCYASNIEVMRSKRYYELLYTRTTPEFT